MIRTLVISTLIMISGNLIGMQPQPGSALAYVYNNLAIQRDPIKIENNKTLITYRTLMRSAMGNLQGIVTQEKDNISGTYHYSVFNLIPGLAFDGIPFEERHEGREAFEHFKEIHAVFKQRNPDEMDLVDVPDDLNLQESE